MGANTELTPEVLREAARLRFAEGLTWERIEQRLKCTRRALFNWRMKGEPWEAAVAEVVEEMKAQAAPTAWGALVRGAARGDVAAAKELLNRIDGAVPQKQELEHSGTVELAWWERVKQVQDGKAEGDDGATS